MKRTFHLDQVSMVKKCVRNQRKNIIHYLSIVKKNLQYAKFKVHKFMSYKCTQSCGRW